MLEIQDLSELKSWLTSVRHETAANFVVAVAMSSLSHIDHPDQAPLARLAFFRFLLELRKVKFSNLELQSLGGAHKFLSDSAQAFISMGYHGGANSGIRMLCRVIQLLNIGRPASALVEEVYVHCLNMAEIYVRPGSKAPPLTLEQEGQLTERLRSVSASTWKRTVELAQAFDLAEGEGRSTATLMFRAPSTFSLLGRVYNNGVAKYPDDTDPYRIVLKQAQSDADSLFGLSRQRELHILSRISEINFSSTKPEGAIQIIKRLFDDARLSEEKIEEKEQVIGLRHNELIERVNAMGEELAGIRGILSSFQSDIPGIGHNAPPEEIESDIAGLDFSGQLDAISVVEAERDSFLSSGIADAGRLKKAFFIFQEFCQNLREIERKYRPNVADFIIQESIGYGFRVLITAIPLLILYLMGVLESMQIWLASF